MSVSNGQVANATTFNNAFVSRTVDTDTSGKFDLENVDAVSGTNISNVQRELNKLNSFNGSTVNTAKDALPSWTNNDVGASTDPVKLRADNLTAKFNATTGHMHTGAAGDGPQISAANLAAFNNFFVEWQTDVFASAAGLSDDVTSVFTALSPGGGSSSVGVPTTAPYNKVELRVDPNGDQIEEPITSKKVYGRLTESAGTWTLTYFYEDSSGVETAYSLPSQDIRIYWREVFTAATRPTFGTDDGFIGSYDATADVVDATATVAGKVSTTAQTFGGVKTFANGAVMSEALSLERTDVASGGTITALTSTYSYVKLTGASTTTIQGIAAPATAKRVLVYNNSSGDLTIAHDNVGASAADRIITSTAADVTIAQFEAAEFIYDTAQSRWVTASGVGGGGGGIGFQEVPAGAINGVNVTFGPVSYTPSSAESIQVYLDGLLVPFADWTLSGMNIVFDTAPAFGQTVYVWYLTDGTASLSPLSGTENTEYRTLTGGEAAAKQLTLSATPTSPSKVLVDVIGVGAQVPTDDFTITGAVFDWNGLGLDGILATGDKIRFYYIS